MAKRSVALLLVCLGALFALPALAAGGHRGHHRTAERTANGRDGWQSGTCYENQVGEVPETPIPSKPTDVSKPFCSPNTPEIFYTQAGGHPPFGFDQYIVRHETKCLALLNP